MNELRFGFLSSTDKQQVTALEALGADSIWYGGHAASNNLTPETMIQLARLSALTERVTVGGARLRDPCTVDRLQVKVLSQR